MQWTFILFAVIGGIALGLFVRVTILLAVCVAVLTVPFIGTVNPSLPYAHFPYAVLLVVALQISYLFGAALPQLISALYKAKRQLRR